MTDSVGKNRAIFFVGELLQKLVSYHLNHTMRKLIMNHFKYLLFALLMGIVFVINSPIFLTQAQANEGISYVSNDAGEITRRFAEPEKTTRGRVRGRVRGACNKISNNFTLRVLVPERTGKTLDVQPTLYWFVSEPLQDADFTFVLSEKAVRGSFDYPEPSIEHSFKKSVELGIHALPLTTQSFQLEKNVEYEWSLALVCDPNNNSLDISATSTIMRVDSSFDLTQAVKKTKQQQLPYIYAKHGLWYNALATLSTQIQKHPDNQVLRQNRASLLKQVGLADVASYDM